MAELSPEQLEALVQSRQPGWEPFAAPLQAMYDYHTPVYRQPSEADMALAAELQKLRAQLANDFSTRTNEAVKDRLGAAASHQQAIAALADAIAKNNQASAEVRARQIQALGELLLEEEKRAQATRYLDVDNVAAVDTGTTNMQGAVDAATKEAKTKPDPGAWAAQGQNLVNRLVTETSTAVSSQHTGVTGQAGAYRTMTTTGLNAINAYVAGTNLPASEQQALREQMVNQYAGATSAFKPPDEALVSLNQKAETGAARNREAMMAMGAKYGLPPELMAEFMETSQKFNQWYDPSDPNAMNQLASAASDLSTEPIRQSLAQLDAQINSLTTVSGDPFYESVAAFQETHPWYETWRRASGFRNHEEAMRWLVNHAEADRGGIVERLDTMWDSKTPDERASITVADMQRELQDVREARKAEVQDQREAARQIGEPPDRGGMRGYQTTKMGRALDEIAGMFRRDPGANPLPAGGMGSSSAVSVAEQTPGYRAFTPKMEEAGRPTYSGKPGEGQSTPRGYPAAPMYRGQGQDAGDAGAGASGSGGPQQGQRGAKPEQEASIRQRVESRLRQAGRGYTFGDYLDNEVMGRVA